MERVNVPPCEGEYEESPPPYEAIAAEGWLGQNSGSIGDDGRVDIDLGSRFCKTLSLVVPPVDTSSQKRPTVETWHAPPTPSRWTVRLNIVIQVVGSRGDVQPFVALGNELQRYGHRVRLATHNVFDDFVRSSGLEFFPIGGDPAELMAYMVKNPGLVPSMKSLGAGDIQRKREMVAEMLEGCWRSCVEPDPVSQRPFVAEAIIANPPSFAHVHCAEALGVPLHLMFTMPWTSTRAFSHPLANLKIENSGLDRSTANYVSFLVVEWLTWQGLGDVINKFRKTIDLDPVPLSEGPGLAESLKIPFTYCWSPALIPKPIDWPSYIDVCGFFFREPSRYTPEPELDTFLRKGPPPVYIGFGSIVIQDPEGLTRTLIGAVNRAGVRAIISRGWSNLGANLPSDENVFFLGDCPHEWLFQYVSAVVHHGGAGTTACGLLNGRPTVIVPFFGDQPFWGEMVAAAGAGPPPIPQKVLNSSNLADAIEFCLTPEASTAAARMAAKMHMESGVKRATESFHANLPLERLQCDVFRDRPAVWSYKKGGKTVRLSSTAAWILSDHLLVDLNKLSLYRPSPLIIENRRWDPVTATMSAAVGTWADMAKATADIVVKPVRTYHRAATNNTNAIAGSSASSRSLPASATTDERFARVMEQRSSDTTSRGCQGTFGKASLASASAVGSFFHAFSKGMFIDIPLATTEGLRQVPKFYGGEVRDHGDVRDWKSGAIVGGRNLGFGIVDGFTDLVNEPIKGAKEEGALGVAKGVAKGFAGFTTKVASGALGIVAYPGQGVYKTARAAMHPNTRQAIRKARYQEGEFLARNAKDSEIDVRTALQRFREVLGRDLEDRHSIR